MPNKPTSRSPSPVDSNGYHSDYTPKLIQPLAPSPNVPDGFSYYLGYPFTDYGYTYTQAIHSTSLQTTGYIPIERPARVSVSMHDRGMYCAIDIENDRVFGNDRVYQGARANVCIPDGRWFYEVEIVKANDTEGASEQVVTGLTRPDAQLYGPPGCDFSGYGLMTKTGDCLVGGLTFPYTRALKSGDVLGFDVCIPNGISAPVKYPNFAPLYKHELLTLETLSAWRDRSGTNLKTIHCFAGSYIDVYLNGELQGQMAGPLADFRGLSAETELYGTADRGLVGYYPTISCIGGAIAGFKFGPTFNYEMPAGSTPLSNRYNIAVADRIALAAFHESFTQLRKGIPLTNRGYTARDKTTELKELRRAKMAGVKVKEETGPVKDETEPVSTEESLRGRQMSVPEVSTIDTNPVSSSDLILQ